MNKGSLCSHLGSWENRGVGRIQWNISNSFENLPYLLLKLKKQLKNYLPLRLYNHFAILVLLMLMTSMDSRDEVRLMHISFLLIILLMIARILRIMTMRKIWRVRTRNKN